MIKNEGREDWRKKAEPVLEELCNSKGWIAKWSSSTHAVQIHYGSRKDSSHVEINRLRVILFAAVSKLAGVSGQESIKEIIREEFAHEGPRARSFGGVEACYFQEAGRFAIIPAEELPCDREGLAEVVQAAFEGNTWLGRTVGDLPKVGLKRESVAPIKRRKAAHQLGENDFLTAVKIIRTIEVGQLPPRAKKTILNRVCNIADFIPVTLRSSARAQESQGNGWKEHAVPCDFLVKMIQTLAKADEHTDEQLVALLGKHLVVVEITKAERRRLDCVNRMVTAMPNGWDPFNHCTFARFTEAGILLEGH